MKTKNLFAILVLSFLFNFQGQGQTNMFVSNPEAEKILLGTYTPNSYPDGVEIQQKSDLVKEIVDRTNEEDLIRNLLFLDTFYNRNTGSDTLSLSSGIGACRTWIKSYFDLISRNNNSRFITGYLEFDATVCGKTHHKNPFAILPGRDTSLKEILVIEGHFDTRNENGCDTQGYTPGSDDNGSGTVLVMEVARVLAKYSFDRTILFTTPTGEDQGLWGAKAWANYLANNDVEVLACLNNDVVGGIYCGKTSSPPSCPSEGHVDSTHVRVFSYSRGNSSSAYSSHKQLARLVKEIQEVAINPHLVTPMTINIMTTEDRSGRSGDHIPFRQKGYPSIRFCSANEHGNGRGDYPDRQHSTRDIFGVDRDQDGNLDSLYVDPPYLRRNCIINAVTLANLAQANSQADFSFSPIESGMQIKIESDLSDVDSILIGVRYKANRSNYFDETHKVLSSDLFDIQVDPSSRSYVSLATIEDGFISQFSVEQELNLMGNNDLDFTTQAQIEQVWPNPCSGPLSLVVSGEEKFFNPKLLVTDLLGRPVKEFEVLATWSNETIRIDLGDIRSGVYTILLHDNNRVIDRKTIVVAANN